MNCLLWLILVSSVHSSPTENLMRNLFSDQGEELTDEEILKALSILMSETQQIRTEEKVSRGGRHEFVDELFDAEEYIKELDQQRIRGFGRTGQSFSPLEKCETTGFETRTREECEEVFEVDCKPIQVKKIRTEIVEKCETLLDRKTCNVTYRGVPKQQCSPRTSKR